MAEDIIDAYLFIPYVNKQEAQTHFDTISHDSNRFLYDARTSKHLEKLIIAAFNPHPLRTYVFPAMPHLAPAD